MNCEEKLKKETDKSRYLLYVGTIAITLLGGTGATLVPNLSLTERILWAIGTTIPVIIVFVLDPLADRAERRREQLFSELAEEEQKQKD